MLGGEFWSVYAQDEQGAGLSLDTGSGFRAGPTSVAARGECVLWLFLPSVRIRVNWKPVSPTCSLNSGRRSTGHSQEHSRCGCRVLPGERKQPARRGEAMLPAVPGTAGDSLQPQCFSPPHFRFLQGPRAVESLCFGHAVPFGPSSASDPLLPGLMYGCDLQPVCST